MIWQRLRQMWWKLIACMNPRHSPELRSKKKKRAGRFLFKMFGNLLNGAGSMFILSYRPDFDYDFGHFPDYGRFFEYWKAGHEETNLGDLFRLYLLVLNTQLIIEDGIAGDFVELGVYKGNSAKILCELGRRANRKTVLFDTFGGFDKADISSEGQTVHRTYGDTSLEAVRRFVGEEDVVYVPGRFPDSLSKIEKPIQIALAHLDCDLYEPMKAGLEAFYDVMSPGGMFILHDYASGWWKGAKRAVDEFLRDKPERLIAMPDKSGTAIFRKIGSLPRAATTLHPSHRSPTTEGPLT